MPAGDAFSAKQATLIDRAVAQSEEISGLHFSVYVGELDADPQAKARELHTALGDGAPRAVLIAVDPAARTLEVVTGSVARRWLDDRSCALAAVAMASQFSMGDLSGGIINGLRSLAEHACHPKVLHERPPAVPLLQG